MERVHRQKITDRMKVDCLLARVFMQFGAHLKCSLSGEDMKAGDPVEFDHTHALVHGGGHTYEDLRPVLSEAHKRKTARDIADAAKIDRIVQKKDRPAMSRLAAGRSFKQKRGPGGKFASYKKAKSA